MRIFGTLLCVSLFGAATYAVPWTRHTVDDASLGADGVRLGDINADGLPDIATAWEEGGVVRVTLHPGHERAKERWPGVTVGRVQSGEDAVFADLDGNGRLDVVSACEGSTRSIFVHWAPDDESDLLEEDAWTTEVMPASKGAMQFMFILPLDMNGDGRIDLVTGAKNDGAKLGWFESPRNPRDLETWKWHSLASVGWVMSIRAVDINHDRRIDVLVSDRRGDARGIHAWLQPTDTNSEWTRLTLQAPESEYMFIDVDKHGDGPFHLAWAELGGAVQFRRIDPLDERYRGPSRSFEMPLNSGSGKAVALGDVNGDGLTDLVVSCEHAEEKLGVFAILQPASGDWSSGVWPLQDISGPEGTKFDRIELVDLDGDGDLDVLTCEERENLGVIWYENPLP